MAYPQIVTMKDEHGREVLTFEVVSEEQAIGLPATPDGWSIDATD
jgi:hypothetical protein